MSRMSTHFIHLVISCYATSGRASAYSYATNHHLPCRFLSQRTVLPSSFAVRRKCGMLHWSILISIHFSWFSPKRHCPRSKPYLIIGANNRYAVGVTLFSEPFIEHSDKKRSLGGNNKLEHVQTDYSFNTIEFSDTITPPQEHGATWCQNQNKKHQKITRITWSQLTTKP